MSKSAKVIDLRTPGGFVVGCNYWASHAGTNMWTVWDPDVIEADFEQLATALQVVRLFPLWPVFQPLMRLLSVHPHIGEYRIGEEPLEDNEIGRAGMSPEALDRFAFVANCAQRHGLKLIVGLLTGWMGGRLYVPPALEGLNVLTDPTAIRWETRFVHAFVRRFKDHPAILAWDLGNECNVVAPVPSTDAAWLWVTTIAEAIRAEDTSRPVLSGMHSSGNIAQWPPAMLGEVTDMVTSHPYPYFTAYCDQDPLNTMRTIMHSTAETRLYADLGGKPCLCEEIGNLGTKFANEAVSADFLRTGLFSVWAHDGHGLLWWCGYDFDQLAKYAFYDWNALERDELGLMDKTRREKPIMHVMRAFGQWLAELSIDSLPPTPVEAVCLLTKGQDQWGIGFTTFIVAKQAGFNVTFQDAAQPIQPSEVYLMPSLSGPGSMSSRRWYELLARVEAGATLYVSHDDGFLSPFNEPFGVEIINRARRAAPAQIRLDGIGDFHLPSDFRMTLRTTHAEVLATEPDGNPAFIRASYGKGQLYFLTVPIEKALMTTPGAFHSTDAEPFWKLYQIVGERLLEQRIVRGDAPQIGLTEHPLSETERVVVAINYNPDPCEVMLRLSQGWAINEAWYGSKPIPDQAAVVPPNDALVFTVTRQA